MNKSKRHLDRCCRGCAQAEAAPGNQSESHDGYRRLDEPAAPVAGVAEANIDQKICSKRLARPKVVGIT